ncbi:site-specific integrase [Candidatus Entotheonella palauensis]|uniref:site-specific integrase n=1 Tax=Candidatus Entotheonella palauensis TaxID=93172 RepID=UPI000B7F006E|nr:site-specific integrase [Candidatus Entotheonella palauensis]
MIDPFGPNPIVLPCLSTEPLGSHIDAVGQRLSQQGYTSSTVQYTMRILADLSNWLQQHTLTAADFNEQLAGDFLQDRYRRCRPHRSDRAALKQLLDHLRDQGVLPIQVVETAPYASDPLIDDFQQYLLQQRCLAPTTVTYYLDMVRHFLRERFGTQPLNLRALGPQDVTRFIVQQAQRYSPSHAKLFVTALRSFFRFLFQRAMIAHDLAQAVPTVPNWRLSILPRFMKAEEVDHLLQSVDRQTPQGQRDYAILLLLARLGLRAAEVVALTLEALDWEAGELIVRSKGTRHHCLPLPHEVGEAVATYLCQGRPPVTTRRVFIRTRAPRRGFANSQGISTIVRRALERAGLNPACKGAHLLRHSLATQRLQNGASLSEIGELLRHQNLETTRIYAKVDQATLRTLAMPWPGGDA